MARKITNYDRHVRIYDNGGKTIDRYTAVYIKPNKYGYWDYTAMSARPFHPQGFGQHGEHCNPIDRQVTAYTGRATSVSLGKRIKYADIPADCQRLIRMDLGQEAG